MKPLHPNVVVSISSYKNVPLNDKQKDKQVVTNKIPGKIIRS